MTSLLRYFSLCLAGLAAACGDEGNNPAAPERSEASPAAAVAALTPPALALSSHALYYCDNPGSVRTCVVLKRQLRITSTGAPLNWRASKDQPWIVLSQAGGATPTTITVSLDTKVLPAYHYGSGTITIAAAGASNSPQTISVGVNARGLPSVLPMLAFSDSSIGFCYIGGNRPCNRLTEQVLFSSTGTALIWKAVSNQPWIVLRPVTGTTDTVVRVSVDLTKVHVVPGTSIRGSITVSSAGAGNSPQTIPVKLQFYSQPLPQ
jgi:hypothetical protein